MNVNHFWNLLSRIGSKQEASETISIPVEANLAQLHMNEGTLFTITPCLAESVDSEDKLQLEFIGGNDYYLRLFSIYVSTLAGKYMVIIYELPKRTASDISGTWSECNIFKPNRLNKKEFSHQVAFLEDDDAKYNIVSWDDDTTYSENDLVRCKGTVWKSEEDNNDSEPTEDADSWKKIGEVIDIRYIRMGEEANGGPSAARVGTTMDREILSKLDTINYNYLIEVTNEDTDTYEFGKQVVVGLEK